MVSGRGARPDVLTVKLPIRLLPPVKKKKLYQISVAYTFKQIQTSTCRARVNRENGYLYTDIARSIHTRTGVGYVCADNINTNHSEYTTLRYVSICALKEIVKRNYGRNRVRSKKHRRSIYI